MVRKIDFKLTGQVENTDLIAKEAWCHEGCRKALYIHAKMNEMSPNTAHLKRVENRRKYEKRVKFLEKKRFMKHLNKKI